MRDLLLKVREGAKYHSIQLLDVEEYLSKDDLPVTTKEGLLTTLEDAVREILIRDHH